jgi:hypothetical protein
MNKSVKFLVATIGWTLMLAGLAGGAGLMLVAALDTYLGVSFVYGISVAAVLINAGGLLWLRLSSSTEVNARFAAAITQYLRKAIFWRHPYRPMTFISHLGKFKFGRRTVPETQTSPANGNTGGASYGSRQEVAAAMAAIHSVICGTALSRRHTSQPARLEAQPNLAAQK